MLSSLNRLPKQEIVRVLHTGAQVSNENMSLRYSRVNVRQRFAVIVSAKIDKRATHRNRIRRVIHESLRHLLPETTPIDGVFVVRRNMSGMSQIQTQGIVRGLFAQANLLNKT